jgi:single-strand DNA-binding protein
MGSPAPGINLSVVRGTIVDEPHRRELPSGGRAVQFDVAVVGDSGTQRVPVSWIDPPAGVDDVLVADVAVVVVGEVRRRFFRVAGSTQSRTEVVVQRLVPCRRRAAARQAVAGAVELLDRWVGSS